MAVLRIDNMIPVDNSVIHRVDFRSVQDTKYRNLLQSEYRILKTREREIRTDARIVYFYRLNENNQNKKMYKMCCDFKALELAMQAWADTHSSNTNDSKDNTCTVTE